MSRPRIAIDATPFETSQPTGVERLWSGVVRALASREDAADVLLVSRAPMVLRWDLPERFTCHVVGQRDATLRTWRERDLPRALDELDVDLLHGPFAAIPKSGAFRRVATVHEVSWRHAPFAEGLTQGLRHRRHLRRLARIADGVLTPSEQTRRDVLEYRPGLESRVVAIHPGVDSVFRAVADVDAERDRAVLRRVVLQDGDREPWLLSVGALRAVSKKDPELLFEVAARVSERHGRTVRLVLAGDAAAGRSSLERSAARRGASVIFTGFVDDAELAVLYRGAAALVHASRSEGFGFPLVEAMASGTPVVAVDAGSVGEVTGGAAEVVPRNDTAAFVDAVCRIVADTEVRQERIRSGIERARAFSWDRFGDALWRLYSAVLEVPARS